MKKILFTLILLTTASIGFSQYGISETKNSFRKKVAVFAPIYTDSVFTGNTFNVTGNSLPKFILPGLDFYNGVILAADSLRSNNADVEILFFDTKSKKEPLNKILNYTVWDSVSFIIASFKDRNEIKPMADFAKTKKIPLISATFPNDGGVTNNPYFIVLNSTLRTHIEEIYKHVQSNYAIGNIVYIKTKGRLEDDMLNIFKDMNKSTAAVPLKFKTVDLPDSFNNRQLQAVLDSTKQNTIICGSINEKMGIKLVKALSALKSYKSVAIGMPTWDGIKEFNKSQSSEEKTKPIEIIYSTPFVFSKNNETLGKQLSTRYKNKFAARASDWFYKGFETTYYFINILLKNNQEDFLSSINNKTTVLFNAFDIQPTKLNKASESTEYDYLENRKLYFIKKQDGAIKQVN